MSSSELFVELRVPIGITVSLEMSKRMESFQIDGIEQGNVKTWLEFRDATIKDGKITIASGRYKICFAKHL